MHRLDDDLALHVFSFLDAKRLSLVMQTARRFRKIAGEDLLWRALLRRDVGEPNLPAHDARTSWRARWRQWQRLESCDCNEQETKSSASPQARFLHRAAGEPGSQLYVFGGQGKEGEFNDLWVLDKERALRGASDEWRFLRPAGATPDARQSATLTSVGDQILMFGGRQGEVTFLNDTWLFDRPRAVVVRAAIGDGARAPGERDAGARGVRRLPVAAVGASAVRFGDRVLVFGGSAPGGASTTSTGSTSPRVSGRRRRRRRRRAPPTCPRSGRGTARARWARRCTCLAATPPRRRSTICGRTTSDRDLAKDRHRRRLAPGRVGHTITALGARLFILGGREYAVSAEPPRPFPPSPPGAARLALTPPPPPPSDQLLRRDDALHQPADAALVAGVAPLPLALGLARGAVRTGHCATVPPASSCSSAASATTAASSTTSPPSTHR